MNQPRNPDSTDAERDPDERREEFAEVDEQVDEQSEGEGLAAEAGRGEETGLAEG